MPCTRQAASSFRRIPLLLACVALLAAVAEGLLAPLVFHAFYASAHMLLLSHQERVLPA